MVEKSMVEATRRVGDALLIENARVCEVATFGKAKTYYKAKMDEFPLWVSAWEIPMQVGDRVSVYARGDKYGNADKFVLVVQTM